VEERHERAEPAVDAPAPVVEVITPPPPAHVEAAAKPRPAPAFHPIPELPPVALTLPPELGLELVETKHAAAALPNDELDRPKGPRRVRPPKVEIPEEPLQLVETQKENQPPAA
jgi:hypothetical protein